MQANLIKYFTFTGIHPTQWTGARLSELSEYTPKLHTAAIDSIKAFQSLATNTSNSDEINSLVVTTTDDANQFVYSGYLGPNAINRSRKALFDIYKVVANDSAFMNPLDSIIKRYIQFNENVNKIFSVSFGKQNGQFEIANENVYNELPQEAKELIRTTILMRELRGLAGLSASEANGKDLSWDSVLIYDRLSRSNSEAFTTQFNALKELQDWRFRGFAENFARSIAYEYDPIARLFIDSSYTVIGPNSDSLLSNSNLTKLGDWNWNNIQALSNHFNSRMEGFGLTAQQQGIFPTILLLEGKQKDFLLKPRTRSVIEGEGISSTIVLDGMMLSNDEKKVFGRKATGSGKSFSGGTGAAAIKFNKNLQAIVLLGQTDEEIEKLTDLGNILKNVSSLPPQMKPINEHIASLIASGDYKGGIEVINQSSKLIRLFPPTISERFKSISERLQELIDINQEQSSIEILSTSINTQRSPQQELIDLNQEKSSAQEITFADMPYETSAQAKTEPVIVPITLESIPVLEEYQDFWGAYSTDILQSFVAYCENTDLASPISVNQTLLRRLIQRSSGADNLPDNHIEIFLGQANSQDAIHRQNRELLNTRFEEVIAERKKKALEKLEKEKAKKTKASTKSTSANNVQTKKTKQPKLADAIPLINQDTEVSAPIDSARITQGVPLARILLELMANKELGTWINNPRVHEEFAFHGRVVQAIINPYASFNTLQAYFNSPEYAAIQAMGGTIQFPDSKSGSRVLTSAEAQGLKYLQSLKSCAAESNVEWEIPVLQKLNGVEELDKLQNWCCVEASNRGNNATGAHQKAFFEYLSTRLEGHKLSMGLPDTPYKLIVKNKRINLSEPLFTKLQSEYPNVEANLSNKRDLTATEFKVFCSALEYILDYESLVLAMKNAIPEMQNELKQCEKVNELTDELKSRLTYLVDRFNTFPLPQQICDKLIKNMPFSFLLNHAFELTASYKIALEEGDFAAPYSTIYVPHKEFIPTEEDELKNVESVDEIITSQELEAVHIFTPQVLNDFLERNENAFVHIGNERLIQAIRSLQQEGTKTVKREPKKRTLSPEELLQMIPKEDSLPKRSISGRLINSSQRNIVPNGSEQLGEYIKSCRYEEALELATSLLSIYTTNTLPLELVSKKAIALFGLDRNLEAIRFINNSLRKIPITGRTGLLQIRALCQLALYRNEENLEHKSSAINSYKETLV